MKQYCPHGHDRLVVGHYPNGRCRQCAADDYDRRKGRPLRSKTADLWDAPTRNLDGTRIESETRYRLHERKFLREWWGMNDTQVADKLGIDRETLARNLTRAGIEYDPGPSQQEYTKEAYGIR